MGSLFVLGLFMCVTASATARNGTSAPHPKTFAVSYNDAEILDLDELLSETDANRNMSHKVMYLSEDTILFLTGPVSTLLMPLWYSLVFLLSMPLNLSAILTFARRIQPKKPAAVYMLNLACTDLLFTLLLPFKISYHFLGNNWVFGPVLCRMVTATFHWNMYCSILLICCISVDRLLAVVYPIYSLSWRRPQNAVAACVTMWVLSFVGCLPLLLSNQTVFLNALNITTCHDVQPLHKLQSFKIYFLTVCSALFFLPLLICAMSYARIIWTLTRVPRGIQGSSRKKMRAVAMAVTVLVIFTLCFLPTNCVMLIHYLQVDEGVRVTADGSYALYLVFLCLGSLNCCLDPVVYYFGSSQCQKQLSATLTCSRRLTVDCSNTGDASSSGSSKSRRTDALKSSQTKSTSFISDRGI